MARAVARGALPSDAAVLRMDELGRRTQQILHERRLVSSELIGKAAPDSGVGVAVCGASALSVMINEEDHLRLQCLMSGLRLVEGWNQVDKLDEELGGLLQLAYHHEFGFLTSCPTNVGTGLRASALLHLPGLVLTKEIERALRNHPARAHHARTVRRRLRVRGQLLSGLEPDDAGQAKRIFWII